MVPVVSYGACSVSYGACSVFMAPVVCLMVPVVEPVLIIILIEPANCLKQSLTRSPEQTAICFHTSYSG